MFIQISEIVSKYREMFVSTCIMAQIQYYACVLLG